jgi:hypothetical protein
MANAINDWLLRESGRITPNINQKMMAKTTPWLTLHLREAWEEGMGNVHKTFVFDRAQLVGTTPVDWANMYDGEAPAGTGSVAEGGSCIPPWDEIKFTQQSREYSLQTKAIWGPNLCVNNLRNTFVREQQMKASIAALADQARETWIERYRSEYTRVSDNKCLTTASFALNGGGYNSFGFPIGGASSTVSILTQGFLNYVYEYLNHQGAQDGAMGMVETRPVYGLVTSARTSRNIIMENADIREDFRYSSQNEKLLAPMGVKWNYAGFVHLIDDKTPRWNWLAIPGSSPGKCKVAGTTLTTYANDGTTAATTSLTVGSQVFTGATTGGTQYLIKAVLSGSTYTVTSVTGGTPTEQATAQTYSAWVKVPEFIKSSDVIIPNPAWLSAEYEDSYIFHQKTEVCLIPKPITNVAGAKFDVVNHAGEFSWKNYLDEDKNPDGTIGRFRGVLSSGTRPENPEFGIVIRHKACPNAFAGVFDCATLG